MQTIDVLHCTDSEFASYLALRDPAAATPTPSIAVLAPDGTYEASPGIWPGIVLSAPRSDDQHRDHLDAMAIDGVVDVDELIAKIATNPQAATALALHQRHAEGRTVAAGFIAESTTYSMLLASHEFAAWRAVNPPRERPDPNPNKPIASFHRTRSALDIELNRAEKRNAINARLRDALLALFDLATGRDEIETVTVRGAGPVFCSGGDLDEFGAFDDPTRAHHLRLGLSLGAKIVSLSNHVIVNMHGACRGSGVELAAFAHTVIAHPNTTFALPEVSMGLIPGAGGTVSITRRIGRLRTTTWALSGAVIDAPRAKTWGLIDVIDPWRHVVSPSGQTHERAT